MLKWFRIMGWSVLLSITLNSLADAVSASASPNPSIRSPQTNTSNMWAVIAANFQLPHYTNNPEVLRQIHWFQSHPAYFTKIANQGQPYIQYIYQQVKMHGLPGELVLLPMIESAYDPFAYSWVGAAGLWQMMPATGSNFGLKQDWWYDGRKDIVSSTQAALDYLTYLETFFNGNWPLAIAAYNSGEGTVQHAIDRNAQRNHNTDFFSLNLPAETESYVPRLLALAAIIQNPQAYHLDLPTLHSGTYFTILSLKQQIDLSVAAKMAGISLTLLYELNPGYSRWATDPKGPYRLLLPSSAVNIFNMNYHAKLHIQDAIQIDNGSGSAPVSLPQLPTDQMEKAIQEQVKTGSSSLPAQPVKATSPSPPTKMTLSSPPAAPALPLTYTAKKGDTLWSIAAAHQVTVGQLRTWNKLSEKQKVSIGQVLIIKPSH